MADALVGNIIAHLRVDATEWQRGLQQAAAQLQQFEQATTRLTSQLNQFSQAFQQAFAQNQQSLAALPQRAQQASQSFQQFNTQINQTNQAFTVVNQTVQQFNTHLGTTTTNVNNVRQGLQQAQGAASGFGSVWQGALSVAGGLGIVTSISGMVSALKSLATESIQAAARMESLRAQFTALQGAGQGAVTLSNLFTTAQRLGVEFGTLATAFRQFDAATRGTALEGENARRVFEQITTGTRAMGASSEQTGRALLALQQMVSKGVVSQEELRQQLGEALPGAMGIAARAFGVTTQEMNKMIEKGMDAVQFVQVFGNQVEREFAGKASTATNTLTSAWQRLTNELEQFKAALLGEELTNSLRKLTDWATGFLETLRQAREERDAAMGGPARTLPPEMANIPALRARQEEIEALRRTIREEGRNLPGVTISGIFGGKTREEAVAEARERLLELQRVQEAAIRRMQEIWAAENERMPTMADMPGQRQLDAMRKRYEEGLKQLRALDATAAFVTPLELAEQKAKAWQKVMEDIRQIAGQIGEGLRSTLTPPGRTTPFDAMITRLAGERGLDPNLMRALIEQESGFNPQARSRAGAMGLMQLMPETAQRYGAGGREFEPEANLRAGMTYFAELLRQFNGNVERALTAYNAGPSRGGIPLPTGENATFAQDVLRRIPRSAGGYLESGQRLEEALRLGVEAEKPDLESRRRILETGREDLRRIEQGMREAEQAQETYQAAIDKTRMALAQQQDQAISTLARLEEAYTQTAEGQDRLTAAKLAARFPENEEIQRRAALVTALSDEAEATKESFNAIKQRTDAQREAADAQEDFQRKLDATSLRLRGAPEEREETRLRREALRTGVVLTPGQEQQLQGLTRLRQEHERLARATEIWRDVSFGIGSAWSQALQSIADHTKTVSEAFRAMGQSILQTFADIAAQQATQAFFKLGLSILTGALVPSTSAGLGGESPQAVGAGINPIMFQHGGVITAPTMAMVGENPSTRPEVILNRQQLQSMFGSGTGPGGQGSPVSIHNYPDKAAAEEGAAQAQARGEQTIINAVLRNLSAGESSSINRAMRTLQR